jgi:hypothetical protein
MDDMSLIQRRDQRRRDVNAGIEQLSRGEGIDLDDESLGAFFDEVKADGRRRLEAAPERLRSR